MYIFFVVSSTGLCIVGSFGDVFGFKDYMAVSKRAIFGSIITILSGFAVIAFEIGHPITMMIYNVLSPGLTSAIWWMGTLYGIYLTFMVIEFIFLMRNDMKRAKTFGLIGLLVGLAAHSNLGGVFGFLNARVVANGVFYPTYFILTAFITGIYLIFLMYGYKYRGKPFPEDVTKALTNFMKIQGLLLAILMFFETWKMLTGVYGGMPERADVIMHILHTKSFWLGEVLCGMVIPFLLILKSKGTAIKSMVWASFIGMIGIFYMRYDLVHDAQLFPMQTLKIREYQLPPSFVDYFPSSAEMMIGFGAIGICLILYFLGTKLFDLDSMPEHH
jgi:molybdopterin-containing oxidoreductase family membrane subunit